MSIPLSSSSTSQLSPNRVLDHDESSEEDRRIIRVVRSVNIRFVVMIAVVHLIALNVMKLSRLSRTVYRSSPSKSAVRGGGQWLRAVWGATSLLERAVCWQQWDFTSYTNDQWRELWTMAEGPGERRGHSLVLFNDTKVILFGGRGNDPHRPHAPKRFDVVEVGSVLEFSTYDGMPLSKSYSQYSAANATSIVGIVTPHRHPDRRAPTTTRGYGWTRNSPSAGGGAGEARMTGCGMKEQWQQS